MNATTKKSGTALSLAALVFLLAACGGGSSSSGSGSSSGATGVNGAFAGDWVSASTNNGELAGNFNASGSTVTATVTRHTVSACPLSSFRGTWNESSSSLDGTFTGSNSTVAWNAKLVGGRLSGPYSVTSGGCAGDTGTITLNRG